MGACLKASLVILSTTLEEICHLIINHRNCIAKLVITDAANSREEYQGQDCDHKGLLVKKQYKQK